MNGLTNDQLSALRTRGDIARTLIHAISGEDIAPEFLAANSETLRSDNLPTEPVNMSHVVGALIYYVNRKDFGEAVRLAAYTVYACEHWTTPEDHGGGVPESFEAWVRNGGAPSDLASEVARQQAEDVKRHTRANAKPKVNVAWEAVSPAQQESARQFGPGATVKVIGGYTRVPEPIEELLASSFEGGDTELGPIEGL